MLSHCSLTFEQTLCMIQQDLSLNFQLVLPTIKLFVFYLFDSQSYYLFVSGC